MSNHEVDYGPSIGKKPNHRTLTVYGVFNAECRALLMDNHDIHSLILFVPAPISASESEMIVGAAKNITWMNINGEAHANIGWIHRMPNLRGLRLTFAKKSRDLSYMHWKDSGHLEHITVVNAKNSLGDFCGCNLQKIFVEDFAGEVLEFKDMQSLALVNCRRLKKVKLLRIENCPTLKMLSITDAKSLSAVEANCSPKTISLHRTSPNVAKTLAQLRPDELLLEGKWEYKDSSHAKIDYPDAKIVAH